MIDYILLILLALEYLYFGLLGLIDPASTSALVAFTLNETISFSEFRALYSFFTFIGLLSVIAIFKKSLRPNTYFVIALLNGSFVFGRVVSILHDGMPDQLLWTIFVVDFTVFILAAWRYNALR
ncbi:MAG: DUF4345 family protein [Pseudomonadota bacterium]|nr:DUF4345 family protein [Pseudomonadota bacterium]